MWPRDFRFSIALSSFFFVLSAGLPSYGTPVISFTGAVNPLDNVNNFSPSTSSLAKTGVIQNTPIEVQVMSDLGMVTQGATTLDPASGTALVSSGSSLMISFPNAIGIRDFSQNLDFTGSGGASAENNGGLNDITITVDYADAMGNNPMSTSTSLDFELSGSGRYDVHTGPSEIITKINVQWINGAELTSSKQIRINPQTAVPEPSSFLFLGLICGIGMVFRKWRKSGEQVH